MILYRTLLLAVMLGLPAQQPLRAEGGTPWYFGARAGSLIPDDKLDLGDGRIHVLNVGRSLSPSRKVECEYAVDRIDFGLRHRAFGCNYLEVNPVPLWQPYFLVGAGMVRSARPAGVIGSEENGVMVQVGIGGRWVLLPDRLWLRADARLRYASGDGGIPGNEGFGDGVLTVGVELPLRW